MDEYQVRRPSAVVPSGRAPPTPGASGPEVDDLPSEQMGRLHDAVLEGPLAHLRCGAHPSLTTVGVSDTHQWRGSMGGSVSRLTWPGSRRGMAWGSQTGNHTKSVVSRMR